MTNFFTRSNVFLFVLVTFIIGVFLGKYFEITLLNCFIALLFLVFLLIPKFPQILKISIILIIMILIGMWRYNYYLPKIDANHVGFYVDNKGTYLITGVVDTEPAEKNSNWQLQISNIQYPISNIQSILNDQ